MMSIFSKKKIHSYIRGAAKCVTNFLPIFTSSVIYYSRDPLQPRIFLFCFVFFYDKKVKVFHVDCVNASVLL